MRFQTPTLGDGAILGSQAATAVGMSRNTVTATAQPTALSKPLASNSEPRSVTARPPVAVSNAAAVMKTTATV
jgi:hypothetical protein